MLSFSALSASTFADILEQSAGGEDIPTPEVPAVPDGFYGETMAFVSEMLGSDLGTGENYLVEETVTPSTSDDPYAADNISRRDQPVFAYIGGFSSDQFEGQQVIVGDRRIVLDPTYITKRPVKGDTIKIDGVAHNLAYVKPIPAAGPVVSVYILQARSGN